MNTDAATKSAVKNPGGLAGITAGETEISAAGGAHNLEYRGYSIYDLAEHATFEEVAGLLVYGELPTKPQLNAYKDYLKSMRDLPDALKEVLERIEKHSHRFLQTGACISGRDRRRCESLEV